MQLKVLERVCLLNILPKEGDFLTLQVARDISDEVSFKPDELESLGMQTANGVTTWNQDADVGVEFSFSEAATSVIVGELQKLDKGKKLSGDLETTALFQQSFPRSMGDASKNPTAGVSKVEAAMMALSAGGGAAAFGPEGLAAGAIPLASGGVRKLILSKPYQSVMAKPGYSPGMLDEAMASMPPNTPPEVALQAMLLARAIAERQGVSE